MGRTGQGGAQQVHYAPGSHQYPWFTLQPHSEGDTIGFKKGQILEGKDFGKRVKERKRKFWNSYIGFVIPSIGQIDKVQLIDVEHCP